MKTETDVNVTVLTPRENFEGLGVAIYQAIIPEAQSVEEVLIFAHLWPDDLTETPEEEYTAGFFNMPMSPEAKTFIEGQIENFPGTVVESPREGLTVQQTLAAIMAEQDLQFFIEEGE